jgi:hypothetical protein
MSALARLPDDVLDHALGFAAAPDAVPTALRTASRRFAALLARWVVLNVEPLASCEVTRVRTFVCDHAPGARSLHVRCVPEGAVADGQTGAGVAHALAAAARRGDLTDLRALRWDLPLRDPDAAAAAFARVLDAVPPPGLAALEVTLPYAPDAGAAALERCCRARRPARLGCTAPLGTPLARLTPVLRGLARAYAGAGPPLRHLCLTASAPTAGGYCAGRGADDPGPAWAALLAVVGPTLESLALRAPLPVAFDATVVALYTERLGGLRALTLHCPVSGIRYLPALPAALALGGARLAHLSLDAPLREGHLMPRLAAALPARLRSLDLSHVPESGAPLPPFELAHAGVREVGLRGGLAEATAAADLPACRAVVVRPRIADGDPWAALRAVRATVRTLRVYGLWLHGERTAIGALVALLPELAACHTLELAGGGPDADALAAVVEAAGRRPGLATLVVEARGATRPDPTRLWAALCAPPPAWPRVVDLCWTGALGMHPACAMRRLARALAVPGLRRLSLEWTCDTYNVAGEEEGDDRAWPTDPAWDRSTVVALSVTLGVGLQGLRKRSLRVVPEDVDGTPPLPSAWGRPPDHWTLRLCRAAGRLPALRQLTLRLPCARADARRVLPALCAAVRTARAAAGFPPLDRLRLTP